MQTSSEMMQNNMLLIKGQNVIHLSFFALLNLKITKVQFSLQEKSFYFEGIRKLEQRWATCIALKGDNIEK